MNSHGGSFMASFDQSTQASSAIHNSLLRFLSPYTHLQYLVPVPQLSQLGRGPVGVDPADEGAHAVALPVAGEGDAEAHAGVLADGDLEEVALEGGEVLLQVDSLLVVVLVVVLVLRAGVAVLKREREGMQIRKGQ